MSQPITLYYFEPGEVIHLAAYMPTEYGNTQAELVSSEIYQVNEDGYLHIYLDEKMASDDMELAVYGEESGFVSDRLGVTLYLYHQGSIPLCQLSLAPAGTMAWREYRIRLLAAGDFDFLQVIPGNYDIEIRDCNGNVALSEHNVDISQFKNLELP